MGRLIVQVGPRMLARIGYLNQFWPGGRDCGRKQTIWPGADDQHCRDAAPEPVRL